MRLDSLDHLVLTVADLERTCDFYSRALGMEVITFRAGDSDRKALRFGSQKINLHQAGREFDPKALHPLPGTADLCFLTSVPVHDVMAHLIDLGIPVEEGPVRRTGAVTPLLSVYIRDPDQNLIEIANALD